MKKLQVWLPMLELGLEFPDKQETMQKAFKEWEGELIVWLLPWVDRPVRWSDGEIDVLAIPAERLDRVVVFHITEEGYVWGPGVIGRFPGGTLDDLLEAWLNNGLSSDVISNQIFCRVPYFPEDLSNKRRIHENKSLVEYVDVVLHRKPYIHGTTIRDQFNIIAKRDSHQNGNSLGFPQWTNMAILTAEVPLRCLLPLGIPLGGGEHLMRAHEEMVAMNQKNPADPKVLQQGKAAAIPYIGEGWTTLEHSWFIPTLLQGGERNVLFAAAKHGLTAKGLPEALQSEDWRDKMTRTRSIRRAWGPLGLFWALFLDKLEAGGIRCCERCGEVIQGKGQKKFCNDKNNRDCYRARRAERKRDERKNSTQRYRSKL